MRTTRNASNRTTQQSTTQQSTTQQSTVGHARERELTGGDERRNSLQGPSKTYCKPSEASLPENGLLLHCGQSRYVSTTLGVRVRSHDRRTESAGSALRLSETACKWASQ
jgi:hypothetical protein